MRARGSAMGAEFRGKGTYWNVLLYLCSDTCAGIHVQLGPMMYACNVFIYVADAVIVFTVGT